MTKAAFVYDHALAEHTLRDGHPMKPQRLRMVHGLLEAYGAFGHPDALLVPPRPATVDELALVHDRDYIDAVRALSGGRRVPAAPRHGFSGNGDNPVYPGMYEAALLSTGASLVAAELVVAGRVPVAFSISGGLHHAMRDHASGFCIFNDPAIVCAWLVQRGLRVAYVDIDAHHGDGVQQAFYTTDRVLTISTHESGRYLFPGTGDAAEIGEGAGRGYAVNLPLFPYTGDECYLAAFEQVVPPLVEAFQPDVLVIQLGVDAYHSDPLTHLQLTASAYHSVIPRLLRMAPKVVALGGGGYDLAAVTRLWTRAYGWMLGVEWPGAIPAVVAGRLGIASLQDAVAPEVPAEVAVRAAAFVAEGIATLRREVFPVHGL